uniref:T9SS type A sorting domain-containing protein n=1 Tax=candidate division WOR-3 bacterium TaxID=2052148 RepID=A0A7V3VUW3_UNCW3
MKIRVILLSILFLCLFLFAGQSFFPNDVRIGDPSINYVNPEISPVGNYMVWIEVDTITGVLGRVWQCGIDPNTGDLIPPNGKGFSPFYSNIYARPGDWGLDSIGPYYVGATLNGQIKFVRPTGPTSGIVTDIPLPAVNKRRVFNSSQLPGINRRFVSYIYNDSVNGFSQNTPQNSYFQLRLLDLDNPANDYLIEEQPSMYPLPIPMDIIVPRWIKGSHYLTYGYMDQNNRVQAKEFNAYTPQNQAFPVTNDPANKIDGNSALNPLTNVQYFMSGINASDTAYFYKRNSFGSMFIQNEIVVPQSAHLDSPSLNQSHEPFFFNGELYSVFQINNWGGNFFNTTFNEPGEIWMVTIDVNPQEFWLLSQFDSTLNVSEPEPYIGNNKVWVYYSANVIDTTKPFFKRQFQLRRCDTPLNNQPITTERGNDCKINRISFYPNPTRGIIFFNDNNFVNLEFIVYNASGQIVKRLQNHHCIDISDMADGVYFIEVRSDKQKLMTKIIKER